MIIWTSRKNKSIVNSVIALPYAVFIDLFWWAQLLTTRGGRWNRLDSHQESRACAASQPCPPGNGSGSCVNPMQVYLFSMPENWTVSVWVFDGIRNSVLAVFLVLSLLPLKLCQAVFPGGIVLYLWEDESCVPVCCAPGCGYCEKQS